MAKYKAGDVILIEFRFAQDPALSKRRPAVILAHLSDEPDITYQICAITSKNHTDRFKGIWVKCETVKGRQMGISTDSFIQIESLDVVKEVDIQKVLGECPFMEELLALLDSLE